jgi:protein gp37
MGLTTIEWAHYTFNPWIGCTKVSPGCANCYAERDWDKRRHRVAWGRGKPRSRTTAEYWRNPYKWDKAAALTGERRRVFCGSLMDVSDEEVPQAWRTDLFKHIEATPNLDWLLLTKRPEYAVLPRLAHIWLGVSVEDQARADTRIPLLLERWPYTRFLSVEPLLSPVDLRPFLEQIDWVIVGGESGPQHRPFDIHWARSIRDQCRQAGVAFFLKQLGGWPDKRHLLTDFPPDLQIREVPAPTSAQRV